MSDKLDDRIPHGPYRNRASRRKGRIIAALALALLAVIVFIAIDQRGEFRSADNTPAATSSVNGAPPSSPREREPQAGTGSQ